jgi:hypothetical protein
VAFEVSEGFVAAFQHHLVEGPASELERRGVLAGHGLARVASRVDAFTRQAEVTGLDLDSEFRGRVLVDVQGSDTGGGWPRDPAKS